MGAVAVHGDRFIDTSSDEPQMHYGELWGDIRHLNLPVSLNDGRTCYKELTIARIKFEEIMKDGGHEDANMVLVEFKKMRILDHEVGKMYRKRKIGTAKTTSITYVIRIIDESITHVPNPDDEVIELKYEQEQLADI